MQSRKDEVARLSGVPIQSVFPAKADEIRQAYSDKSPAVVVEVATQEQAFYWRVGDTYYLDDPYFGDVVAIDDLRYDSTLGLYDRRAFPDRDVKPG